MTDADDMLLRILGVADALFLPVRDWSRHLSGARTLALAQYAERGIPFRMNAAGDEAKRKAGENDLVALADAGFIALNRGGKTKFPGCRLTVAGEMRARALADLPNRSDARVFLKWCAEIASGYKLGAAPEIDFCDGRGWGPDATREERQALGGIENLALPSLHAGWSVARSTIQGHAAYLVTEFGFAELKTPTRDPKAKLPAKDAAAVKAWAAARDAKLAELAAAHVDREIGTLPLPVGEFLEPAAA